MKTIREFTSHMWYAQQMIIIPWQKLHNEIDIEKIKANAIYIGTPHELRSVIYDNINNKILDSYGVIDNTMIITVHGD